MSAERLPARRLIELLRSGGWEIVGGEYAQVYGTPLAVAVVRVTDNKGTLSLQGPDDEEIIIAGPQGVIDLETKRHNHIPLNLEIGTVSHDSEPVFSTVLRLENRVVREALEQSRRRHIEAAQEIARRRKNRVERGEGDEVDRFLYQVNELFAGVATATLTEGGVLLTFTDGRPDALMAPQVQHSCDDDIVCKCTDGIGLRIGDAVLYNF